MPITIVYDTLGATPIGDVIAALQATEVLVHDAVSLLPSLISGVNIELRSVNVQRISQESPLKEIIFAAIWVTSQKDLEAGVTTLAEQAFGLEVPSDHETLLTLVVLVVLLYGVDLAKNIVSGRFTEGAAKRKLKALVADLSQSTGKTPEQLNKILDAKYAKPSPVKTLVKSAVSFFLPSMREGSRAIDVDGVRIEPEIVGEVPYASEVSKDTDYKKFEPHSAVALSIHAQDMDKGNTGWAAVPGDISQRRLRLKLIPPVEPLQIWGKSAVIGDIILISKLTGDGYEPVEIHLTNIVAAK